MNIIFSLESVRTQKTLMSIGTPSDGGSKYKSVQNVEFSSSKTFGIESTIVWWERTVAQQQQQQQQQHQHHQQQQQLQQLQGIKVK